MSVWFWVFWLSVGFVAYTYVGYPLLLILLRALRRPPSVPEDGELPTVSVMVAVRNEAGNIERKLRDLLALNYPADRLEIRIASDASSDGTDERVRACADPRVRLVRFDEPVGKALALNRTFPQTTGEIVVIMDVRQRVDPDAVRRLVRHFADPAVGVVGGEMVIVDRDGNPTTEGTGLYWRLERSIRAREADLGLLTGVSGCFFGLRREVFRPIPPGSYCEDVTLVLFARERNWQVRWARDAHVFEELRSDQIEFSRKVRTLVGNYQLLRQFWPLYLPWRGSLAFTLISHKLCRLFVPLALAAILVSSAVLSFHSVFFAAMLAGEALVYALGLLAILRGDARRLRLVNVCGTFCMLNGAALVALVHVLRHGPRIGWR